MALNQRAVVEAMLSCLCDRCLAVLDRTNKPDEICQKCRAKLLRWLLECAAKSEGE